MTPDLRFEISDLKSLSQFPMPSLALSVILPAFDEARRLPPYLAAVRSYLDGGAAGSYEVIVVDDGSRDDTAKIVAGMAEQWPQLRLLRHARNEGKGAAVRTGMTAAQGELLLFADADGAGPSTSPRGSWPPSRKVQTWLSARGSCPTPMSPARATGIVDWPAVSSRRGSPPAGHRRARYPMRLQDVPRGGRSKNCSQRWRRALSLRPRIALAGEGVSVERRGSAHSLA